MNKSTIYNQITECLLEDMDGEFLLYNPNNATTLHLNGPSSVVWELCNGENSVDQMIAAVSEAYPEQASQVEADIIAVLGDFLEHEIIVDVTAVNAEAAD